MTLILEIEPSYEPALRAAGLGEFDAMMRAEGGAAASRHAHRETVPIEVQVAGRPKRLFLKRVFKVPLKHGLWPVLRGGRGWSQPRREWHMLRSLEQAGIDAMRRVAFGERRCCGVPVAAFLLVEAVPMEHTLEYWLMPGFPKPAGFEARQRRRLLYELGRFVGRLQCGGFVWPDFQAKHVFAAPAGPDQGGRSWEFRLIDVERMTQDADHRARSAAEMLVGTSALAQLSKLRKSLRPMPVTKWHWLCFCAGYISHVPGAERGRVSAVLRDLRGAASPAIDAPDLPRLPDGYEHPRCIPLKRSGRILMDERMGPWLERAGLKSLDDVFRYGAGESMPKPGLAAHRDRIRIAMTDGSGANKTFYLKRYRRAPLKEQIERMRECGLKSSSGLREMRFIRKLALLGIPTMRWVACGQRMRGVLEQRSFGITEAIEGDSLEHLAARARSDPSAVPAWTERREIILQLALLTRLLHQSALFHRDLYLSHVFLSRNAGGEVVLHLIDLARMIERRRNRQRWRIKDLASLDYSAPHPLITRADRLRFLYDYLSARGRSKRVVRRLIRSIRRRTKRIARHDARRSRRFGARAET